VVLLCGGRDDEDEWSEIASKVVELLEAIQNKELLLEGHLSDLFNELSRHGFDYSHNEDILLLCASSGVPRQAFCVFLCEVKKRNDLSAGELQLCMVKAICMAKWHGHMRLASCIAQNLAFVNLQHEPSNWQTMNFEIHASKTRICSKDITIKSELLNNSSVIFRGKVTALMHVDFDVLKLLRSNKCWVEQMLGKGQSGIIPSSFIGDLNAEASVLNSDDQLEAEIRKKKNKILMSVPSVKSSNPIEALTNYCRHILKFDIEFRIEENQSIYPSEHLVKVFLPSGIEVASCSHTKQEIAKKMAAIEALAQIKEDQI